MTDEFIPYGSQWIDDHDIEAVVETLKSDYLTTGPKIKEFENKFANYVDSKYAVAIANGTAALHAAVYAAGIKEGDEVITTPITFAATANSVLYRNAKPIFADIDPKTYNISLKSIEEKITDKTKAIIPVHYTGQPCEMDDLIEIASKNNLIIIEDGAHAIGATYKDKKIGSIGDMTTFSFHPVKNITTGEGGMITSDSKELYDKLMQFRTHGITKSKSNYTNLSHGPWYHEQQELGYNYRITDIQAALGITQLEKLDKFLSRRREIVDIYNKEFKDIKGLIIPEQLENTNSAWHIYVLQLELEKLNADRKKIFEALREKNLGVNVHYIPVYFHPYYQSLGYKKGICPNAEKLYERIITIPLYPKMSDQQVNEVILRIINTITKFQK